MVSLFSMLHMDVQAHIWAHKLNLLFLGDHCMLPLHYGDMTMIAPSRNLVSQDFKVEPIDASLVCNDRCGLNFFNFYNDKINLVCSPLLPLYLG